MCGSCYFTLSDRQLYVNVDKLLVGPKGFLPPPYNMIGGGGGLAPIAPPPVPTPMVQVAGSVFLFNETKYTQRTCNAERWLRTGIRVIFSMRLSSRITGAKICLITSMFLN